MASNVDVEYETPLPANVDAEKTILGAILLDNEIFFDDSVDITPNDLSLDAHRRIYQVMNEIMFGLVEGVTQVDIVTLSNELTKRRWIDAVGGVAYLAGLTEGLPRRPKIGEYVRILKDKARLRKLIAIFTAGADRARDQSESSSGILESVQNQLIEVDAEGNTYSSSLAEIDVEQEIRSKRVISDKRTALEFTWGIKEMDEFTHGAFRGEFSVIAGEESGGKSSLLLQTLMENAKEGTECALFSLEMSKSQVKKRCYPLLSEILTSEMIRDPRLMNLHTHIPEMERVTKLLAKLPLHIDDTRQLRIDKLIARMRMMRKKFGCKLFGIDYIQLVKGMPKMTAIEAFWDLVIKLRDFPATMEPDCHVIALSSYSNTDDGVGKSKKRSTRSLFGGSILRYAAQNVIMLAIEDPEKKDEKTLLDVGIKFAKQRDGKRGKVECYYDREHYLFCQPQPPLVR
jgi:replicative DNA helicase